DQRQAARGPASRQDQTGDTAAGAEVDQGIRCRVEGLLDDLAKPLGVRPLSIDRAGTQKSELLRPGEHRERQLSRMVVHSGRITTRRRGSSPSEPVATPSISERA